MEDIAQSVSSNAKIRNELSHDLCASKLRFWYKFAVEIVFSVLTRYE